MEDKNHYLDIFDEAETLLLQLSDTVAQLREIIDNLVEENNKLRMSNNDLKSLLIKSQAEAREGREDEADGESQVSSGRDSLLGFYNEGIHVCHEFFGSRRSSNEQCLFCQEVLERLENHS